MEMTRLRATARMRLGGAKAQAMVIDGLFFLMLCGACAAALIWAGSVYGDKSFEAYRYIYMTDYASGALQVLSTLDYEYERLPAHTIVNASWLDELGRYMKGEFDSTTDPGRYGAMYGHWSAICNQAPAPLLLTIFTESADAALGKQGSAIQWSCGGPGTCLDETDKSLLCVLIDDTTGGLNPYKYPYYSSPAESKSCSSMRCEMEIKIYY